MRDVLGVARVKANLALVLTGSLSQGAMRASPMHPLARYRHKLEILIFPDQLPALVVLHHRQLLKDILNGAAGFGARNVPFTPKDFPSSRVAGAS